MILLIVGSFLMLLGLTAGLALLAATLGLAGLLPGLALWITFPAFCIIGHTLVMIGAKLQQIRTVSLLTSIALLGLSLAAAAALVASGAGLFSDVSQAVPASSSTAGLWFVLCIAGILGTIGAASFSRTPTTA